MNEIFPLERAAEAYDHMMNVMRGLDVTLQLGIELFTALEQNKSSE